MVSMETFDRENLYEYFPTVSMKIMLVKNSGQNGKNLSLFFAPRRNYETTICVEYNLQRKISFWALTSKALPPETFASKRVDLNLISSNEGKK